MRAKLYGLLGMLAAGAGPLAGHPISMTTAEVEAGRDSLKVTMRVMVEDLALFHQLKSDSDRRYSSEDLRRAAGEHGDFILKYFDVRNSEGEALAGRVSNMDASDIPDEGVTQIDLMKHQVAYVIAYAIEEAASAKESGEPFLTFTQNFGGDKALVPAVMDFTISQSGVWLDRPVQLSAGVPHTVAFDWEHPPDAPPKNWRELKRQKEEEYQRRLGITSYTGVYSYIYVTGREVRHEILVPLLTFEEWLAVPRRDPEFLEVDEQEAARAPISAFLRGRNPIEINGVSVAPVLERLQFFGLDINDFAQNAEPRRAGVYQARIGIILSYQVPGPVVSRTVKMTWDTFSKSASFLKSFIYVDENPPEEHFFAKDQPHWEWTRVGDPVEPVEIPAVALPRPKRGTKFVPETLTVGLLSAGLCWLALSLIRGWKRNMFAAAVFTAAVALGLPPGTRVLARDIDANDARRITEALLPRVYGAFERNSEEAIYDALAESVDGEMLETLYVQFRQALEMKEQGGAVARVKSIQFQEIQPGPASPIAEGYPAFDCLCRWHVTGTVEHWGHIHTRENAYEAVFKIIGANDGWRMAGYEARGAELVRMDTGLRF